MDYRNKDIVTPCFILDTGELTRSIRGFQKALGHCFARYAVGYSVKTNSLPYCLGVAKEQGCHAEVVSADEYELALLCGYDHAHIIYNGPMKSRETFLDAVTNGSIVNIETHRELEWLKELPKDKVYGIGLRLNINITQVSPDDADGEKPMSSGMHSTASNRCPTSCWQVCTSIAPLTAVASGSTGTPSGMPAKSSANTASSSNI